MKTATVLVDTLVYDRGADQTPRFVAILDDTGDTSFVDDNGHMSDKARAMVANAMDTQAVKQGAVLIPGSTCIDTGSANQANLLNDAVYAFDEGAKVWLDDSDLYRFMLEQKLMLRDEDMLVTPPVTMDMRIDGAFRKPIEELIPLIVDEIVKLINKHFPFMKKYTGFVMTVVTMYGGVNNISKKYLDRIFVDVEAKIS